MIILLCWIWCLYATYLTVYLSDCLLVSLFTCLTVYLSHCLLVSLPVCLSDWWFDCINFQCITYCCITSIINITLITVYLCSIFYKSYDCKSIGPKIFYRGSPLPPPAFRCLLLLDTGIWRHITSLSNCITVFAHLLIQFTNF